MKLHDQAAHPSPEKVSEVPQEVLSAFGATERPVLLVGGQGETYRSGDRVFKKTNDPIEAVWCAETMNALLQKGFRVPRHLQTKEGKYVRDGWTATSFVEGRHEKDRWEEKMKACGAFHASLKNVECPAFLLTRNNPWSIADRVVWGEQEIVHDERLEKELARLRTHLKSINLPCQLIHGDFTGNVLMHEELPPAIIDFSPYWRPTDFAKAIIVVDALVWEGADKSILNLVENITEIDQLLLRAEMRRLIEIEECIKYFGKGTLNDIEMHKPTVELLCSRFD